MLPEIVFLAEPVNALCRHTDLIFPDVVCLIVIQVYGRIQAVLVKSHYIRKEFPCPVDCLTFKIISEREISEHFKKSSVA